MTVEKGKGKKRNSKLGIRSRVLRGKWRKKNGKRRKPKFEIRNSKFENGIIRDSQRRMENENSENRNCSFYLFSFFNFSNFAVLLLMPERGGVNWNGCLWA